MTTLHPPADACASSDLSMERLFSADQTIYHRSFLNGIFPIKYANLPPTFPWRPTVRSLHCWRQTAPRVKFPGLNQRILVA